MSTGTSPPIPQSIPPLSPEEMPDYDSLVTEDGKPVDSIYSERQMELLREPLYTAWNPGRDYVALCNVGLFFSVRVPPLVPDVLLSLDVQPPEDLWAKRGRSYFIWEFGKPPDAVFEIVSNTEGEELGFKRRKYAELGILYYVVWDPHEFLKAGPLHILVLRDRTYNPLEGAELPLIGLSLTRWQGEYRGMNAEWLRWCDGTGRLLPTGAEALAEEREQVEKERERARKERGRAQKEYERAQKETERAQKEHERAQKERERAEVERERADRLAAQLRALGINPDDPS
jgi:hypothetical protein